MQISFFDSNNIEHIVFVPLNEIDSQYDTDEINLFYAALMENDFVDPYHYSSLVIKLLNTKLNELNKVIAMLRKKLTETKSKEIQKKLIRYLIDHEKKRLPVLNELEDWNKIVNKFLFPGSDKFYKKYD